MLLFWGQHNNMNDKLRGEQMDDLFKAILTLETTEECYAFFEDLCTIKEIDEMAKRLRVAKMLVQNKIYLEVAKNTGRSTATISRINRCIKYGSGGYTKILKRLDDNKVEFPKDEEI